MKRIILVTSCILTIWFFIHTLIVVSDGLVDELGQSEVAVVLGNKVEPEGNPSKRLKSRLDRAVELYNSNLFKYIIVSGGLGKEGYQEAEVMKEYLVNAGIPEDFIIVDNEGNNTWLSALNTKRIGELKKFQSVTIITQYYHVSRSELAFRRVGFSKIYSAHARIFELRDIYSIIREFAGYYKYLFY